MRWGRWRIICSPAYAATPGAYALVGMGAVFAGIVLNYRTSLHSKTGQNCTFSLVRAASFINLPIRSDQAIEADRRFSKLDSREARTL
jgi:hypothetical protein